MSLDPQKFCLKWNDFRSNVTAAFEGLRQDEELVDMTLCCEGRKIKAHRMMLSACSPFFRDLLKENPCQHPVFFLRDVTYQDLWSVIEFVYKGEVNVSQGNLASFLKTAEMLQLRGLTEDDNKSASASGDQKPVPAASPRPAGAQAKRPAPGSPAWEADPGEPAPLPTKRPRPADGPAPPPPAPPPPPPPPPPAAAAVPGGPVVVKREAPPFESVAEVGYGAEQESDARLRRILYHDMTPGSQSVMLEPDISVPVSTPALQLLDTDAAAAADRRPGIDGDNQQLHACETCGKAFRHRNSLSKHRKVHLGETECQKCGTVFSSKWMLSYHWKHSRCALEQQLSSQ